MCPTLETAMVMLYMYKVIALMLKYKPQTSSCPSTWMTLCSWN